MRRLSALPLLTLALALAACDLAPPPERQSADAKEAREATELRERIQQPIDKAKAVEDVQEKQAEDQKKAIEDQGG
jgi:hypothetical protein